jgi:nitroreductase
MDNNLLEEILSQRRSCRKYLPKEVSVEKINQIIWGGTRAPYASGGPRREIYAIHDEELRKKMVPACMNQPYVIQAGVIMVSVGLDLTENCRSGVPKGVSDSTAATMCMDLQARSLGLETVWLGHFEPALVKGVLESSGDKTTGHPINVLLVGYCDEEWNEKHYKDPSALGYNTDPWGDKTELTKIL